MLTQKKKMEIHPIKLFGENYPYFTLMMITGLNLMKFSHCSFIQRREVCQLIPKVLVIVYMLQAVLPPERGSVPLSIHAKPFGSPTHERCYAFRSAGAQFCKGFPWLLSLFLEGRL